MTPFQLQVIALIAARVVGDTLITQPRVCAFIEIESAWNPTALRAEPRLDDASYGLMQLLYGTARGLGFTGNPADLYDPTTNIMFGVALLRWNWSDLTRRLGRTPTVDEWVASYNAGTRGVADGDDDEIYVGRWRNALAKWTA